jgi:hypothetical protein
MLLTMSLEALKSYCLFMLNDHPCASFAATRLVIPPLNKKKLLGDKMLPAVLTHLSFP